MADCDNCIYFESNNEQKHIYICKKFGKRKYPFPTVCEAFSDKIEGLKYDEGKNRMGLMCENFSRALWEVAKVSTFGANRYGANNWQLLDNPKERYMDALCRHLFKHLQGKKVDDESGLLHLSHLAWNALCLLEFELKDTIKLGSADGMYQALNMAKEFLKETESEEE